MHWWAGQRPEAEAAGAEAASILAGAGDRRAWAMALSNQAQLLMLSGRWAESLSVGRRAAAMAREVGDAAVLSHALTNMGASLWDSDPGEAERTAAEALSVALAANEIEHACRAYAVLTWHLVDTLRLDEAGRVVADGVDLADQHEFLGFGQYLRVQQGEVALARADWEQADRLAEWAVDGVPTTRCPALVVQGRVRARRGTPGAYDLLVEAWAQAERLDEAQRTGPAGAALVEAAWLAGRPEPAVAAVLPRYEQIRRHGSAGCRAEVAYWLRRAGAAVDPDASSHPYSLLAAGKWAEAARIWQATGCRYEHALALADSDDPSDVLTALATLDDLGAEPLARRTRQRLRQLGVAGVPRGPAPSTRDNPGRLTARQVEVVRLLAGGLTNPAIAARLVLSVRTVDAHVAAVLDKLGVSTRQDAVERARELGLVGRESSGKAGGRSAS
jgi:ATP/maltotriose-dependent transcriptional regulator MalT